MQAPHCARAIACLLTGTLSLPHVSAWAGPADELRDLVGARGAGGEA